jgi:hypothetical protein
MDSQTRLALITAAAQTLDSAAALVRAETPTTAPTVDPIVKQLLDTVEHILGLINPIAPAAAAAAAAAARPR